jgi:hypothetical protein
MKKQTNKKYYKSECGMLIYHNVENGMYVHKNTISKDDKRMSKEQFDALSVKEIRNQEYSRLMNIFYKDIHEEWWFDNKLYVSKDNFISDGVCLSTNYNFGKQIPFHDANKPGQYYSSMRDLILVYHWGKVYYHTISYGGYKQGQLIDPVTHEIVRWCQLKHCAPIYNKTTCKIM